VPKGTLGEDTSRLLGGLLVARVWQEALRRSRQPESERADCCLYVDEVHNYIALPHSFEDLLAEARGYRLSLCLAHQNLTQLPRAMADALSANARTKLIFNCSPEDARSLERHVTPELTAHDLANLARHQAACRTLHDSETLPSFTLSTQALPDGDERRAVQLRARAEQRFGSDPRRVDRRLRARQLRVLQGGKHPDSPGDKPADGSGD
jgi:TraM recognition site of TraD and TraG